MDTSAFLVGYDPFSISEEQFTVPNVKEEIAESSMPWVRFKTAVENGRLKVRKPSEAFLNKVMASATSLGDAFFLSETDMQLLALASELKSMDYQPLIITDDYSIQNVANQMGIEFASLATLGIRRRLQWLRYCPACHKKYPADYKSKKCRICGTELKRKPVKESKLRT
ncbi:MAG: ribonuclease VapC [Candidatus Bathyarchaeia archaeon]